MIVPLVFKRLSNGTYMTPGNDILIRRVISQGYRSKETVWTVQILNCELPKVEMSLKDAKEAAWRFILAAVTQRVYDFQRAELEDSINRNRNG